GARWTPPSPCRAGWRCGRGSAGRPWRSCYSVSISCWYAGGLAPAIEPGVSRMSANDHGGPELSDEPPTSYPEDFLRAFRAAAAPLGWQVKGWQGDRAVCLDPRGKPWGLGLDNVYQRARRAGPDRWPGVLAEFLAHMASTGEESPAAACLEDVAGRLLVRL